MAAIAAANQGAEVTLIEKKDQVGKKILATGNGKCNFTNRNISGRDYYSRSCENIELYFNQFNEEDTISTFLKWGMMKKERDGYCYPRSEQAATVLGILKQQCYSLKITVCTGYTPVKAETDSKGFMIECMNPEKKKERLYFDRLILACGSYAGQKPGEEFTGYDYAASFGHSMIPVVPSLVQVTAQGKEFRQIAGVRCQARIRLLINGEKRAVEEGELQLTDFGISGIPVFQFSRFVSYGALHGDRMEAVIDFLPELTKEKWSDLLEERWNTSSKELNLDEFFQGFLHSKLNGMFIRSLGYVAEKKLKYLNKEDIFTIAEPMKHWQISLTGTKPYLNAQVCAGGVSMEEITEHMESRLVQGLFFCGEMLDVDGRCGGYNLQWAWTSGYLAGTHAGRR